MLTCSLTFIDAARAQLLVDKKNPQNHKARMAILEYLALLLPRTTPANLEAAYNAGPTEGRQAFRKIIEMTNGRQHPPFPSFFFSNATLFLHLLIYDHLYVFPFPPTHPTPPL